MPPPPLARPRGEREEELGEQVGARVPSGTAGPEFAARFTRSPAPPGDVAGHEQREHGPVAGSLPGGRSLASATPAAVATASSAYVDASVAPAVTVQDVAAVARIDTSPYVRNGADKVAPGATARAGTTLRP